MVKLVVEKGEEDKVLIFENSQLVDLAPDLIGGEIHPGQLAYAGRVAGEELLGIINLDQGLIHGYFYINSLNFWVRQLKISSSSSRAWL